MFPDGFELKPFLILIGGMLKTFLLFTSLLLINDFTRLPAFSGIGYFLFEFTRTYDEDKEESRKNIGDSLDD